MSVSLPMEMLIYTCPRCKICTGNLHPGETSEVFNVCPAYTRYGFFTYAGGGKCYIAQGLREGVLEPDEELADVLYHCTLCGSCAEQCATDQDPRDIARLARREVVNALGGPPGDSRTVVKSTLNYRNPYQQPKAVRYRWAKGKEIKDAAKEKVETLFYVGCTAAMIPERTHFALNTVRLLELAGEDFGTLGQKEICCGATTFNLGAQEAFREVATENNEMLNSTGIKRVLTSCAGCYSVLKHEYPKIARRDYEVVHVVEYLDQLLAEGRLQPKNEVDIAVTYHDPCHLGRYSGLYDAPRNILEAIPGVELIEMTRNREKSWCCGAGAGVKTNYPDFAQWVGEQRVDEAKETGAGALVSACPFCEGNLADVVEATDAGMQVFDVTDLLLKSLE